MNQISLRAYGKINLTLDVVGRRDDGYHLLESVMQSISLADEILLTKQNLGITICTDHPAVPNDSRNICYRAAQVFQDYTGLKLALKIELIKKIPVQAGLGGGSADAAAVLVALNQLYATKLSLLELQKLGLQVGADLPFCLQGGTALVQGIGENVQVLDPLPDASIILLKPDRGVSTKEVYEGLQPSSYGNKATAQFVQNLKEQASLEQLSSNLANTLESVTLNLVPEVREWKKRLLMGGALGALMSGSGTTIFGIFADVEQAMRFKEHWKEQGQIFVVKPVRQGVEQLNGGDL